MIPRCDNGISPEDNDYELHTSARVENASKYSDVVEVKLIVYDLSTDRYVEVARSNWKDGGFTIILPKALDPNYLHSFIHYDGLPSTITHVSSTLTISNKNVKILNVSDFIGVDKDGNAVTRFYPFKVDKDGNFNVVRFIYVDSDATISGYIKTETAIAEFDDDKNGDIWYVWEKTMNFSLKWKKGWNVWLHSRSYTKTERTIIEQWTTTSESELKWSGEDL